MGGEPGYAILEASCADSGHGTTARGAVLRRHWHAIRLTTGEQIFVRPVDVQSPGSAAV